MLICRLLNIEVLRHMYLMENKIIHISQDKIKFLVFHDSPIIKVELNEEQKIFKMFLGYAGIEKEHFSFFGERVNDELGKGVLIFKNWRSLNLYNAIPNLNVYELVNNSQIEPLEEILTFRETNDDNGVNVVKIGAFGIKSRDFFEWHIIGSEYYGEFEEYDTTPWM